MSRSTLRPAELAAAALLSAVMLTVAIAPALFVAHPATATTAAPHGADTRVIEYSVSPEWRLA
jgi:hypothetical protein